VTEGDREARLGESRDSGASTEGGWGGGAALGGLGTAVSAARDRPQRPQRRDCSLLRPPSFPVPDAAAAAEAWAVSVTAVWCAAPPSASPSGRRRLRRHTKR
jgi:hypothetical protein